MAFNSGLIGKRYPEVKIRVTAEIASAFARSIGETDPIYLEDAAAKAAGHPAQLAPPTIPARLQIEAVREITNDPDIGAAFDGIVHGEQVYTWTRPIYVGDELSTVPLIADVRAKGSVSFMDVDLDVRDADGQPVLTSRSTLVHFQGEGA